MNAKSALMRELPLLVLFGLIVVAIMVLGAHHVTDLPFLAFGVRDHLGALCLIAVHELLRPVHYGFHALLIAGFAFAVWDRVRAFRHSRWILEMLQKQDSQPLGKLIEAAGRAGIAMTEVVPVRGLPVPAFTAGWLRPRVYVAVELIDVLAVPELAAVLAHEAYHVWRKDPLRLFALRFMGALLFWV
ncbi:MAG: M48 family metalloprotease, partial [Gemmatimonadota bacterium]